MVNQALRMTTMLSYLETQQVDSMDQENLGMALNL